jgi:uncharacterized protein
MKKGLCGVHWLGWVLVVIGAINWGLIGIGHFAGGDWNVVGWLLGSWPVVENLVYILVGLGGVALLFSHKCKTCTTSGSSSGSGMNM